jgi:hypothetical protein
MDDGGVKSVLPDGHSSSAACAAEGFTATLTVDLRGVEGDEALYEAGPLRLGLRMAGETAGLEKYDRDAGNYLAFAMPDGRCPVLEATLEGLRVGIPLGFLERPEGIHEVVVQCARTHLSIQVDGHVDDDMFKDPDLTFDLPSPKVLSARVKSAVLSIPAPTDMPSRTPDSHAIEGSVQYWTPTDHNAWVGDVAPGVFKGRLHVFYLFDRRHHGSKLRKGGHYFAHLSSDDLVHWTEHPHAVEIEEWWETFGTGTPFMKDGKLCLAYGLHTSRLTEDAAFPIGGTYALSDDGVHFAKSRTIFTDTQNPSVYNRPDGGYELVMGYGKTGELKRSDDFANWTIHDDKLPFGGDCPSLFDWHGRRYLLQGFSHMACSENGAPGTFADWSGEPDVAYDGLAVPMVVPWRGDRRLYVGWLRHVAGWGGWLVFRELVFLPDGHLGLKWVPEIEPPAPPVTFKAAPGEKLVLRFSAGDGRPALLFTVDPERCEASFADDVPEPEFTDRWHAVNVRIGGLRCVGGAYEVRMVVWYDRKAGATIFDAEIGGERTIICRRAGRFQVNGEHANDNQKANK